MNFRANFTYTIGQRYKATAADTCKSWRHVPHFYFDSIDNFLMAKPRESHLVAVEMTEKSLSLKNFIHPERAIYLLGAEDYGIPQEILRKANMVLKVPTLTFESLNVGICGGIVMYDRFIKRQQDVI